MPFEHKHVLADWHMAEPKHVQMAIEAALDGAARVVDLAVRGSRGGAAQGRRAARDDVARDGQRGDDARTGEDGVSVGDRRRLRAHRLLALQRRLRARALPRAADQQPGRVESARVPAARRLRLRGVAVQLHGDRRQPLDGARAHGRRVDLEAGVERDAERLLRHARARGRRAAAGRHQLPAGQRRHDHRRAARVAGSRRHSLHGQHRSLPEHVEDGRREHRAIQVVSAARRRDRRQGLHRRAPVGRCRRRWRSRSCAAGSSTRARSARRRAASTCRSRSGTNVRDRVDRDDEGHQDGRRRATSATS